MFQLSWERVNVGAHTVMRVVVMVSPLVLNGQANLHITLLKLFVTAHAIWSPFRGIPKAENLACSYPEQVSFCRTKEAVLFKIKQNILGNSYFDFTESIPRLIFREANHSVPS